MAVIVIWFITTLSLDSTVWILVEVIRDILSKIVLLIMTNLKRTNGFDSGWTFFYSGEIKYFCTAITRLSSKHSNVLTALRRAVISTSVEVTAVFHLALTGLVAPMEAIFSITTEDIVKMFLVILLFWHDNTWSAAL